MESAVAIILAAGRSRRMHSQEIKVLHPLVGRPMLEHVVGTIGEAGISRAVVVVGYQADRVRQRLNASTNRGVQVDYALQRDQLGTGHAVMQTEQLLKDHVGHVIVTYGDTPLYRGETFVALLEDHIKSGNAATVLSTHIANPHGYGRVVRDKGTNGFLRIVEQSEIASESIERITEINTGTYVFTTPLLFELLDGISNDNEQGEYFLPDALKLLIERHDSVGVHVLEDADEALGINDRCQLAEAEAIMRRRLLERFMDSGVTIVDPESTHIHSDVVIHPDTVIHPFTVITGETTIGHRCHIGPHAFVSDATVDDDVVVEGARVSQCQIGQGAFVGSFVHVPSGARVAPQSRIECRSSGKD